MSNQTKSKVAWKDVVVSDCGRYHKVNDEPLYEKRFERVLKYHEPGLAPVVDEEGAYHIDINAVPAYSGCFQKTFGFYEGLAAVEEQERAFHIYPTGDRPYDHHYLWCGNFQEGRCVVRDVEKEYFHIDCHGVPTYERRYRYVGDYKDGVAVAYRTSDGKCTHIDLLGNPVHGQWFDYLDIYHKGFACAKDGSGWFHLDKAGQASYSERYIKVEPFYNGKAVVQDEYGELKIIDEQGYCINVIRDAIETPFQRLSGELVGYWKTQTIRAAVVLGVFDALPANMGGVKKETGLSEEMLTRLLRALRELKLIWFEDDVILCTEKGWFLTSKHPLTLASSARHWGSENYLLWHDLLSALSKGESVHGDHHQKAIFDFIDNDASQIELYQHAMNIYARHDYSSISGLLNFNDMKYIVDAGGGEGFLINSILDKHQHLKGMLLERPKVVAHISKSGLHCDRLEIKAFDLFEPWPVDKKVDAVFMSRIVHDWNDAKVENILFHAASILKSEGRLYLLEIILQEEDGYAGMLDLNMLVVNSGKERTIQQFNSIVERVGMKIKNAILMHDHHYVIEIVFKKNYV